MTQLEEILNQDPVYLHDWRYSEKIGVISDFEGIDISKKEFDATEFDATEFSIHNKEYWLKENAKMEQNLKEWEGINILFASYYTWSWTGNAFVLFEKDGKLFEVNENHNECDGLIGQFKPEETTLEALRHRLVEERMGLFGDSSNEFADELKQFLGV